MDDIDEVVALREHFVNFLAALIELRPQGTPDSILNDLWMGLIAHSKDIFLRDHIIKAAGCGL